MRLWYGSVQSVHDASHSAYLGQDLATREHQEQQRQLAEVSAWLAANDKGDKVDVDEVTEPKDPLARQYADTHSSAILTCSQIDPRDR